MAMPSQNGPGYSSAAAKAVASRIYGMDGEWSPHAPGQSPSPTVEPLAPLHLEGGVTAAPHEAACDGVTAALTGVTAALTGVTAARHEAAYRLITNHQRIVRFASRGASEP
jgi:hypothetical protein